MYWLYLGLVIKYIQFWAQIPSGKNDKSNGFNCHVEFWIQDLGMFWGSFV